jgi:NAD+ synthase
MRFHRDILKIDRIAEIDKLCDFIRKQVRIMKCDGAVIGLSGGIDSALASALCVKALGKEHVLGAILPEKESNPISEEFAIKHAKKIGIDTITENITPTLEGFGSYKKRDQVIKEIFPSFNNNYKSKIVLPPDL